MSPALLHLSPDTALVLLTLGIFLIYVELNRPGSILPGAIGLTTVLIAVAVLFRPPLNYISLILILAAITLFARGLRRNMPNALYVLATLCLAVGYVRLVPATNAKHLHALVAVLCALLQGFSTAILTRIARRARRNKGLD